MEGGGRSSRSSPVVRESPPSSPSFNSYSSPTANLAEIAARVVEEFRHETNHDGMGLGLGSEYMFNDDVSWDTTQSKQQRQQEDEEEEEDEFEFEFAVLCNNNNNKKEEEEYYTCTADHIFFNGQIKPFYPLFNTDLLFHHTHDAQAHAADAVDDENKKNNNNCSTTTTTTTSTTSRKRNSTGIGRGRGTLGKLMMEERESSLSSSWSWSSSSSCEADDLDTLQPGTYCVWTPNNNKKEQEEQGSNNKKSCNSSTGSSKRWNKLRELLLYNRSNSGGNKDSYSHSHRTSFVLFTPTHLSALSVSSHDDQYQQD